MKVLMIGATGAYAGLVLPELKKKAVTVVALVQNEGKASEAMEAGADETVIGSLDDKASLLAAAKGMDGVFHIIPAFHNGIAAGVNMVDAAKAAGVKKFVFSSVYHPSLSLVNHAQKRPAEEVLYQSGMDYTILQPAMFMQMLSGLLKTAQDTGKITGAYSKDSKMSYVDYRDVAEAAAMAMTGTELSYGTFELCSPGMYSRADLAAIIGETIGKNVVAEDIPTEQWAQQVKIPPGEMREGIIAMTKEYDRYGFSGGNSMILKTILKREPKTVSEFIKELSGQVNKNNVLT